MEEKKLTGYPSIDRPWLKYYSEEAINTPLPERTVYENIWQHNKDYLGDIALEYYGCKIAYRKLFYEAERAAKALRQAGVKKGDCVALCMAGVPEAVYLVLACSRIGAIANFINPMFTTEQMIGRINDTEADILIVLDAMYRFITDAIDRTCVKRVVVVPATGSLPAPIRALARLKGKPDAGLRTAMRHNGKYVFWKDFIRAGEVYAGQVDEPYEKDRPVVMVYSSGTTGASKGIQLTNDGINATIHEFNVAGLEFSRHQIYLHIVPVWFSTGIIFNLLFPLQAGMITVLEPVFSIDTFAVDVKKYKPSHMMVATSLWLGALNGPEWKGIDLSFLVLPMTGGETLLPRTEAHINVFFHSNGFAGNICKGYGMCELGSAATTAAYDFNKTGSVGIPLAHIVFAAFNTETNDEQPYFCRGELRVISPCRMLGYYKNPEATAAFFRTGKDGQLWACTGDIGYIDEDGNVFVLGRASDYFLAPGGEKVYLFDVENVILQDAAVELCEVVAVGPDGCAPVAHMVLTPNACTNLTEIIRRVDALCRAQLPEYAVPVAYKFRDSFPVKPSGKRDADALKAERDGYLAPNGEAISFSPPLRRDSNI